MVDLTDDDVVHEDPKSVARIRNPPIKPVKKRKTGGSSRNKKSRVSLVKSQTEQDSENDKKVAAKPSPKAPKRTPLKAAAPTPPTKEKRKAEDDETKLEKSKKQQAFHREHRSRNLPVNQPFHPLQYP